MNGIAPGLDHLAEPIDAVHNHPENPRRGDVAAISESLTRFGQVRPVLALLDGTVIAGNHVLRAARSLDWDKVAVSRVDLPPGEAEAYLLADNRLAELGTYADDALARVLTEIGEDLSGTGYRQSEVDRLIRRIQPDSPDEFPAFDGDLDTTYECKHCGYTWS